MPAATEFWRDPRLPHVESRRACNSRDCYRAHAHGTYSIGAVDAGGSVFSGAPGGVRLLRPGSLVTVPAGRVHACNPMRGHAWSYQMLHLDAAWLQQLRNETAAPAAPGAQREPIRVSHDPPRYRHYSALTDLLFSDAAPQAKEAGLVGFIGDLDHRPGDALTDALDDLALQQRLQPLMAQLRTQLAHSPALADMAQEVGMSRYQLIRAFRRATGLTPHAWQMDQRIQQARLHLRDGQSLATVAHALGFADQSHFQRVFKSIAAATPGQYRR
ncbi:AraC family transcriptional regulator [Bacillus subtilis subsp. subtilis]|nr:AraC family transcriptional regulator [Bacillus subtilis subsp. subtilis]